MLKHKYQSWLVWGIAVTFYFYEFLLQVSPNVMVPELMQTFQLSAAALGNLTACYFYAYAAMQIPSGILLDRYGPRILLTLACISCVIGCLLFAAATYLLMAQLGRLFIGFGGAFAILGCFKLITTWFPKERFVFVSSLTVTVGMLGAIGGQAPLAFLVEWIDWRASLITLGLIGIIISLQIWRHVRDYPGNIKLKITTQQHFPFFHGIKQVLKNRPTWLLAIYGGLMFAPTSILGALWGVPFLVSNYNISRPLAAGIISMLFVGWAVGCPISGLVADYLKRRALTLWVGTVGACLSLVLFIYLPMPLVLVGLSLFAFGFFSSGFLPSFAIVREINSSHNSATALGFMNMMNMVGGALGQPFIGWLLDTFWNGKSVNHVRIYQPLDFKYALLTLPLGIILALIVLLLVQKKYHLVTN